MTPTMEVVEMVLNRVNKEIVTLINQQGNPAVGISGKDGELVVARQMLVDAEENGRTVQRDIGHVGEIIGVNPRVIHALTAQDFIPVIAPIGIGLDGETYNINADLFAGKIAEALQAEKFILLTDVAGIQDKDDTLLPTLTAAEAEALIAEGVIHAGMIPKVECCIAALHGGAQKAHVLDGRVRHAILLEILTKAGIGTEVVRRTSVTLFHALLAKIGCRCIGVNFR